MLTEAGHETSRDTVRRYREGIATRIDASFVAAAAVVFPVDGDWLLTGMRRILDDEFVLLAHRMEDILELADRALIEAGGRGPERIIPTRNAPFGWRHPLPSLMNAFAESLEHPLTISPEFGGEAEEFLRSSREDLLDLHETSLTSAAMLGEINPPPIASTLRAWLEHNGWVPPGGDRETWNPPPPTDQADAET